MWALKTSIYNRQFNWLRSAQQKYARRCNMEKMTQISLGMHASGCYPFVNLPNLPQVIEGNSFAYDLRLAEAPTDIVSVAISASGCELATPATLQLDSSQWTTKVVLKSHKGHPTAKDSALSPCRVTHSITTEDPTFSGRVVQTFVMTQLSEGCGVGEYFGTGLKLYQHLHIHHNHQQLHHWLHLNLYHLLLSV